MYIPKVQEIREYFYDALCNNNFIYDKTGVKLIELVGAQFIADQPSIFGVVNQEYINREINWYNKQSLNINDFEGDPPAAWKATANEHGDINSNYGWCIFSQENGAQYKKVIEELKNNCESRRAIMIYTRPFMHYDYNFLDKNDFICTNTVQYFIRNDKLVTYVNMRSNDVIYGYKNDFAWQEYISLKVYTDLRETYPNLEYTNIIWNVGSLHVYERHFDLVKNPMKVKK
jgi:thymidylate synthase